MAGGTWTAQNKVRPGVYIRFRSAAGAGLTPGDRGTATICEALSWGPVGQVMEVEAGADMTAFTGYGITEPQNLFLREIFKGTDRTSGPKTVLLYRPSVPGMAAAKALIPAEEDASPVDSGGETSAPSSGQIGETTPEPGGTAVSNSDTSGSSEAQADDLPAASGLLVTANYPGSRGNGISIIIAEETDGAFLVSTVVDHEIVDQQEAETAEDLKANDWVTFSGGPLAATAGVTLSGGEDGERTVPASAYASYLEAIEPYPFDVMIYDGEDETVKAALASFIKRMAEENGQYSQLAAANLVNPDSMYVINVQSSVILSDKTVLTPEQVTWWFGGATAGARYNESLTYARYPGAAGVAAKLTNSGYTQALQAGQLVLSADNSGVVKVEQDINSMVTFSQDFGKPFRKNRVLRLCSTIANDVYQKFSENFIGVVHNNPAGRSRFKAVIVGYLLDIQDNGGIQNFSAADVEVLPGEEIDAVVVNLALNVTDAVEKIYLTVVVS